MNIKDVFLFLVFLVLMIIWTFHIPYSISPNVVEAFSDKPHKTVLIDINLFAIFLACLFVFVGKKYLDSQYQQYRFYRIFATLIANSAFIFAWFIGFGLSIAFYCRYYWAANCRDNIEGYPCNNFPIEIDIAYLLQCIPIALLLVLILYFAFYNKILSQSNCLWLFWLPCFMLISILLHVGTNGAGCYD